MYLALYSTPFYILSFRIKISLNKVRSYLLKPCFESASSFSYSTHLSGCEISFSSANGHTYPLVSPLL